MVEFNKTYKFTNCVGEFIVNAKTDDHPSEYGNGMVLLLSPIVCPKGVFAHDVHEMFDIRYNRVSTEKDIRELVMRIFDKKFGVTEDEIKEIGQ